MKIAKKILLAALVGLPALSGCEKILEPKIYSQINAEEFPKTEADVLAAFIPFYVQFNPFYGTTDISRGGYDFSFSSAYLGYTWATTVQTDEANDLSVSAYGQFTLGPATVSNSSGRAFYNRVSFVAKLTDLISLIERSTISNKQLYVAEAKALRGWFMYILYDLYGPISVKLDPATVNSVEVTPRLSRADYVKAMESDLQAAIAGLPDRYNGTANWGRVSKGLARMVLFKVHLHNKEWAKAKEVGRELTTMGYQLMPSYKDAFNKAQNNEVIFAVPGNNATFNIWFATILPFDAVEVLGNDVRQGDKYKLIEMPWSFYDSYSPGDSRLETIADSYARREGPRVTRASGLSGAIPMKYTQYVINSFGFDYVVYRYADVLLAMAEITNELDGPTDEAKNFLTQVTNRAGTTATLPALTTKDQMRDFLLAERGRELYFEFGIRRQDLIRHGTFISNARARGFTNARDTQVLFPIPADVIIQSGGVIEQNPGY